MNNEAPSVPDKRSVCGDVRVGLRPVLPAGLPAHAAAHAATPASTPAPAAAERALREERACARFDIPCCHAPRAACRCASLPACNCGLLHRTDILLSVTADAAGKAAEKEAAAQASVLQAAGTRLRPPLHLTPDHDCSAISLSIGRKQSMVSTQVSPSSAALAPAVVVCVPAQIRFVNFVVGQTYTRRVRVVNVSRSEVRLSLRPPAYPELRVTLGAAGLALTAGATTHLTLHFTPRSVRAVCDELRVRSAGARDISVPVLCYMEPPVLHIAVGNAIDTDTEWGEAHTDDVLDLGARLLGDTHYASLVLASESHHVVFWLVGEEAWMAGRASAVVAAGPFLLAPARVPGGAEVRGAAWCRSRNTGLATAAIRILCSTGVARPLNVIADVLMYSPLHVTIQAFEKDYDICSPSDSACDHYVSLGESRPGGALSNVVRIINNSPLEYRFSWRNRPWGLCACALEAGDACPGDEVGGVVEGGGEGCAAVLVEPDGGLLPPRSVSLVRVRVQHVGMTPGVRRTVLMLVLHDIPKESLPLNEELTLFETTDVMNEPLPGVEAPGGARSVSAVCAAQLEVWWRVQAPRVVLTPPRALIRQSRRGPSAGAVSLRAVLLDSEGVFDGLWSSKCLPPPSSLRLYRDRVVSMTYLLPLNCSDTPLKDTFKLRVPELECETAAVLELRSDPRSPALRPAHAALGVLAPDSTLDTKLFVVNDTAETISFSLKTCTWVHGENETPCSAGECYVCHVAPCLCVPLRPTRGHLQDGDSISVAFSVPARREDGASAWLVALRRDPGTGQRPRCPPVSARATLITSRSLAPRVIIQPMSILQIVQGRGLQEQYTVDLVNLTPVTAWICWEPSLAHDEGVEVELSPAAMQLAGRARAPLQVQVTGTAVAPRRLLVRVARVSDGQELLTLLLDITIEGVELEVEVGPDAVLRTTERAGGGGNGGGGDGGGGDLFHEYDKESQLMRDPVCGCPHWLEYEPPAPGEQVPVVGTPPVVSVCACAGATAPFTRADPLALTFTHLSLDAPSYHSLVLRNTGRVDLDWSIQVRYQWEGVELRVWPAGGALGAGSWNTIRVEARAFRPGLHRNQLLISAPPAPPLVLDVWTHAPGCPLRLPAASRPLHDHLFTMWAADSDPLRTIRAQNLSVDQIRVTAFIVREYDDARDTLPFRLLYRLSEPPPPTPPPNLCSCGGDEEAPSFFSSETSNSTDVELWLAPDEGEQEHFLYDVYPEHCEVPVSGSMSWTVSNLCSKEPVKPCRLVLRLEPQPAADWRHAGGGSLAVRLLRRETAPSLLVSPDSVCICLEALDLPPNDVLRARSRLLMRNVGVGPWRGVARAPAPWRLLRRSGGGLQLLPIELPANSSIEFCIEVEVDTEKMWPRVPTDDTEVKYEPRKVFEDLLSIENDEEEPTLAVPLKLEVRFAHITLKPSTVQLSAAGGAWLEVAHSAPRELALAVEARGVRAAEELCVGRGGARLAVAAADYVARGEVRVRVAGPAGRWCYARALLMPLLSKRQLCITHEHDP